MANLSTKSLGFVISAIKNLREIQGSTSREIVQYISSVHDIPTTKARRQVQSALKRGVAYGILKKSGGHYSLPTDNDLARQEVAIQEIDLLDLYCQRKINRSRVTKPQTLQSAKGSRKGRCRCGRRRRRRSQGCALATCKKRQRGRGKRRSRSRAKRGGCRCGGRGGCAKLEGGHEQKGDKLMGLDEEETEARVVVGTGSRSSVSGSSSPERTAADNNTELRDRDMPLSH